MTFTIALLILGQSAAPQVGQLPVIRTRPVAVQARASVRVIRPVRLDFSRLEKITDKVRGTPAPEMQRSRDASGRRWIEFS